MYLISNVHIKNWTPFDVSGDRLESVVFLEENLATPFPATWAVFNLVFPLIITMSAPGEHIPLHDWENTTADVVLQINIQLEINGQLHRKQVSRFIVIT